MPNASGMNWPKRHPNVHLGIWETRTKRFYRVRPGASATEEEAKVYVEKLRRENLSGFGGAGRLIQMRNADKAGIKFPAPRIKQNP